MPNEGKEPAAKLFACLFIIHVPRGDCLDCKGSVDCYLCSSLCRLIGTCLHACYIETPIKLALSYIILTWASRIYIKFIFK